MPLPDPRRVGSQTISPRAFSPTCDASLPGVLRGTSGRRGLGVPDLWLHPPHARSGESGDRLHAPWPGPPRRVRVWPREPWPHLGHHADGPREPDDRELPVARRGRVRVRRLPRRRGRPQDSVRAGPSSDGLEEVVQFEFLRVVVGEQRRDRVLDQVDSLTEVVRHFILLADALGDLEVFLHGAFVDRQGEVPATFDAPRPERNAPILRPTYRAPDLLACARLQVPDET